MEIVISLVAAVARKFIEDRYAERYCTILLGYSCHVLMIALGTHGNLIAFLRLYEVVFSANGRATASLSPPPC